MANETRTDHVAIAGAHLVVLLVGAVDRRLVPAVRLLARLPDTELRAVHISLDADASGQLALDWMDVGLSWLPLHIHDSRGETLEDAVRSVVAESTSDRRPVTVVVPELEIPRWWSPLLHRRSARRIARRLQALTTVTTVIVPWSLSQRSS